jgi:hypothetical protein
VKLEVTFDQLRPGDVLLEADGVTIGPVTVERAAEGRGYLDLVRPSWMTTLSRMYRGFAEPFLVERPDAGAAKADPADAATLKRLVQYGPRLDSTRVGDEFIRYHPVPPGRREHGARPEVGDVVLFDSAGYWRPAVVIKVGRVNLRVVYMTPHGIKELEQGASWPGILGCQRRIADVYVVTGEEWAQQAIAGSVDH